MIVPHQNARAVLNRIERVSRRFPFKEVTNWVNTRPRFKQPACGKLHYGVISTARLNSSTLSTIIGRADVSAWPSSFRFAFLVFCFSIWVRLKRLANSDRFRRAFLCAPNPLSVLCVLCVEAVDVDFHSRPATRDSRPVHQSTPPKSHTSPQPPTNKPDINFPKVSHCPYPICYPKNRDRVQTNPGPLTVSGN